MHEIDGETEPTERHKGRPRQEPTYRSAASGRTLIRDEADAGHPSESLGGGQCDASRVRQFDKIVRTVPVEGAEHEETRADGCQYPADVGGQFPKSFAVRVARIFAKLTRLNGSLTIVVLQRQVADQNAAHIGGDVLIERKVRNVTLIH